MFIPKLHVVLYKCVCFWPPGVCVDCYQHPRKSAVQPLEIPFRASNRPVSVTHTTQFLYRRTVQVGLPPSVTADNAVRWGTATEPVDRGVNTQVRTNFLYVRCTVPRSRCAERHDRSVRCSDTRYGDMDVTGRLQRRTGAWNSGEGSDVVGVRCLVSRPVRGSGVSGAGRSLAPAGDPPVDP